MGILNREDGEEAAEKRMEGDSTVNASAPAATLDDYARDLRSARFTMEQAAEELVVARRIVARLQDRHRVATDEFQMAVQEFEEATRRMT